MVEYPKVILVDFDGTVVPKLPIGYSNYNTGAERVLRKLVDRGHKIVLWTCRNNSPDNPYNYINGKWRKETSLEEAVRWFKERDIELFGINSVPGEVLEVGTSRKALSSYVIDDTSICMPMKPCLVDYVSYETGKEVHDYPSEHVDWDYVESCLIKRGIL